MQVLNDFYGARGLNTRVPITKCESTIMYVLFIRSNVVNLKSSKSCEMITQMQCYWIWLTFQFHSNLGWNNGTKFHLLFYSSPIWDETMLLDFVHFFISPTWDETMLLNFIHNNYMNICTLQHMANITRHT